MKPADRVVAERGRRRWWYHCTCPKKCNKGPMIQHLRGSTHGLSYGEAANEVERAQRDAKVEGDDSLHSHRITDRQMRRDSGPGVPTWERQV